MNISFVIPNYNGENLINTLVKETLTVIERYGKIHKIDVVFIDDNSQDNSAHKLKELVANTYKNIKITILENSTNMGFAQTVNKGVKNTNGEIVVLLNTDVVPSSTFLEPLINHFEDKSIFAVGCMDKSIEGEKEVLRGRGLIYWQKGFLLHKRGEVDKHDTAWVSGGSGAFRKEMWDILGGLDPLYSPFYWEDIDLSYKALKSGYTLLFEPKSVVIHKHAQGSIKKNFTQEEVRNIAYRNQFIFVWENITDFSLLISHIFWLPYHILNAVIKTNPSLLIGFFMAIGKIKSVIDSRGKAKRLFILKDKDILKSFQNK